MDLTEDATVTYTVKEMLGGISTDVKEINSKLDAKVDQVDFVKLEGRVTSLEKAWWSNKPLVTALAVAIAGSGVGIERLVGG